MKTASKVSVTLTDPLGSDDLAWLVDTGYPSFIHVPHLGRYVFVAIEHIFVYPKELVYFRCVETNSS